MRAIEKKNTEHYAWGAGCDGWHFLKAENLSIIEERMPPGASEMRHHHEKAHQFFYVLSGTLSFEIDGKEFDVVLGQGIEVKPSIPHRVFNRSRQDAGFLVISSPPSHGDRVADSPNLSVMARNSGPSRR